MRGNKGYQFRKTPCSVCGVPVTESGAARSRHMQAHVRAGLVKGSEKTCLRCNVRKSQDEFPYAGNTCRACKRLADARYRNSNERRAKIAANVRRHYERNRDAYKQYREHYKATHPDAYRAGKLLRYAVERGKIKRPLTCGRCGKNGKIQASHDDYSRPYDVEWLCALCHRRKDFPNFLAQALEAKENS